VKRGAKLYAIDPRRTASAQWADVWLGLDIGTDIPLANAMGREIISAGLCNTEFIERATTGFEAFKAYTERVFMVDECQPKGSTIKNLRIHLSRSGDVAWFSCLLDDWGEWAGEPWDWRDVRWTGVLQKMDGRWVMVQQHFSKAEDAVRAEVMKEAGASN